jgi:hypothetical protein
MRFTILSILSLGIFLISAGWADDQVLQEPRSFARLDDMNSSGASNELLAENSDLSSDHRFGLMRPWTENNAWDDVPAAENLCYKLRRYLVQRDDPGSDSTHIVGSSKCHRASRYSLREIGPTSAQK